MLKGLLIDASNPLSFVIWNVHLLVRSFRFGIVTFGDFPWTAGCPSRHRQVTDRRLAFHTRSRRSPQLLHLDKTKINSVSRTPFSGPYFLKKAIQTDCLFQIIPAQQNSQSIHSIICHSSHVYRSKVLHFQSHDAPCQGSPIVVEILSRHPRHECNPEMGFRESPILFVLPCLRYC